MKYEVWVEDTKGHKIGGLFAYENFDYLLREHGDLVSIPVCYDVKDPTRVWPKCQEGYVVKNNQRGPW